MTGEKPDVHVLATGGTIANPQDVEGYITGEELIADVPEASEAADLTVEDVASVGSSQITVDLWYELHGRIEELASSSSPPDGIVITHGSNTVEETAYFLNLTLNTDVPVVLTASQRYHGDVGNDGDRNFVDAVRVAGDPDARGRGVLLALHDQVFCARDVTKEASGRPDAWTGADFGPVGLIDKYGTLEFYYTPDRAHTTGTVFDGSGSPSSFPTVQVIYSSVGDDGTLTECAVESGADGLVLAALPTGRPSRPKGTEGQNQAVEDVAEEIPVVISSRGHEGFPSESSLESDTLVWGDTLTPQKARILLALAIERTNDPAEIQSYFRTY